MKKIISIIAAFVLAGTMSVSAFAADYGSKPDYPLPTPPSPPVTTPVTKPVAKPEKEEDKSKPGSSLTNPETLITKETINDAIKTGKPVYALYTDCDIKSNAISQLAKNPGRTFTVITKRYTAAIKADSITEPKNISLAVNITKISAKGAMVFNTEHKGNFGCTVDFSIGSKYYSQCGVDLNKANLYFVDEDNKVTKISKVKLDKNGNIVISASVGGKYIVM